MEMSSDLIAFVSGLKAGPVTPQPENEDWKTHIDRISVAGQIAEITEDQYDYWLDVLPPKLMLPRPAACFCFAEGAEAFRLFWTDKPQGSATRRYLGRQLSWDETVKLCKLAGCSLPW